MKMFDEIKKRKLDVQVIIPHIYTKVETLLDQYILIAREGQLDTDIQREFLEQIDCLSPYILDYDAERFGKAVDRYETLVRNIPLYRNMEKEFIGMADVRKWELTPCSVISIYLPLEPEVLDEILLANDLESCVISNIKCDIIHDRDILYGMMDGSIREVNYFFHCISEMDERQREIFGRACSMYSPRTVKDMINLAANIDGFIFYDMKTMSEFGEYLIKNDLFAYTFEDHSLPFLNYEKIADWHIRSHIHRCQFREGYIENTRQPEEMIEVYDGVNLPSFSFSEKQEQTAGQDIKL